MEPDDLSISPSGGQIALRYWASARAAAGVATDLFDVVGPVSLSTLVEKSIARHDGSTKLAAVLETCSVLIGDRPAGQEDRAAVIVQPGACVEFLPPFAGG